MLEFNQYSFFGAFVGLFIGYIDVAIMSRMFYPALRLRHEEAKVTGRTTVKPSTVMGLVKLISFVAFPLAGYMAGNVFFGANVQAG